MKTEVTTEVGTEEERRGRRAVVGEVGALVVLWSAHAPERVGQVLLLPREGSGAIGRGATQGVAGKRLLPVRQVPGVNQVAGAFEDPKLSREHLRVERTGAGRLAVENLGRRALRHRGQPTTQAVVEVGSTFEIDGRWLFLYERRPRVLPEAADVAVQAAGSPDAAGMVGETPAMWRLRDRVAFVGPRAGHVLVTGPSGAGKELVARALHAGSPRDGRALVSRNAATIPEGLLDAELFGNVVNYPNPGMPERPGLVGAADGGTLFLDEVGELPEAQQAHLLRLLDGGEYQRLGEARSRTSDLRLVAATNRDPRVLKADFHARFRHHVDVPPIQARRADVPLLARHLLRRAGAADAQLKARFFEGEEPMLSVELVDFLVRHDLTLQTRELDALLWRCLGASPGDVIEPDPALLSGAPPTPNPTDPTSLDAAGLREALEAHGWVQEKVWRALGLQSRYVLRRLMRKHGIQSTDG